MKKVTFTFTRQTAETPWYWQIAPSNTLSPVYDFIEANSSRMESYSYDNGNQNITTFTFNDEQVTAEFQALIENEINTEYVQYCEDNNITIDVVAEDI
jgi:hypothetical protein